MTTLFAVPDAGSESITDVLATARAFTRDELIAMSSRTALERAVASGRAVRLLPRVYAGAAHATSFHVRAHAALLWAGEDAVVSGSAALFAWGLIEQRPAKVEIALPQSRRMKAPPWLRVRRCTTPVARTQRGLLQVATPAFAIVHGYGQVPADQRATVVYGAVQRRLVGVGQLQAALDVTPRVAARKSLQRRVWAVAVGAESYLEEVSAFDVFNTKEFAHLVRQHEVVHEGELFRLDMYDPVTRTCIEADGKRYHSTPEQHQRDTRRDAILATRGILTVRLTYDDICDRPEWCRMIVRQVLAARIGSSAR